MQSSHNRHTFSRYGTKLENKNETHFCDATERYIFSPMGRIVRASRWRAHLLLCRCDVFGQYNMRTSAIVVDRGRNNFGPGNGKLEYGWELESFGRSVVKPIYYVELWRERDQPIHLDQ
jgi:hypothetical protein